ncbi:MAG: hypothetical protein E6J73_19320, partial [Deltaproteobacteria bacterium]
MKFLAHLILFVTLSCPLMVSAQSTKPSTLAELSVYNGTDREQLLFAGAKKEGKVVWYTALAGGSYKDLARAFETKYGVQVEAYRGASRDLIAKVLAETQAKKYL